MEPNRFMFCAIFLTDIQGNIDVFSSCVGPELHILSICCLTHAWLKIKSLLFRMLEQNRARTLSPTAFLMKGPGGWAETVLEKSLVPYWLTATAWSPTVRHAVRL